MSKFSERLRLLRNESGLSQFDFAKQIGVSKSSVNMYERGEREPGLETLEAIADYFNIDMDYLLGKSEHRNKTAWLNSVDPKQRFDIYDIPNVLPLPKTKKLPLVGTIACGEPILAEENIEDYISAPEDLQADFCLRCKGDSMINARIFDGDIVYIHHQPMVENGEIAAVMIDDEATLKRVRLFDDHISLEPENPLYRPLVYWAEEMNTIHIIGKAVAFTSKVR